MPLFESAMGGTAVSIVEQAVKAGKYAAREIREAYSEVDHAQRMIAASNAYIDNYLNRYCQIKIMPGLRKEPLDLESIYTDVKILDDRSIRAFLGPDELESAYREKGNRRFGGSEAERINGMTVANAERFLMVLGVPGIGKSTFLRKIGLEALKQNGRLQRACIPVFLELKKFREETIDIQQKIVEEFDTCKFPAAAAFVDSALEQGKLLVLFDGLDEVPSAQLNQVIEKIENFVDKHDKNSFVASCRTAAYRSSFRRFTDVTISEFDDEQIKQFIYRWFSSEEKKAERYNDTLNQPEYQAAKELAQTPLLLTFLCMVYEHEQMVPKERSTLYGKALSLIFSEWSIQNRLDRDPIYEGLHPNLEKEMLSKIAYESFKQDQLFFPKDVITNRIRIFLSKMLDAPKRLDADSVLYAIESQQGIVVERATDIYSFSHLTLQEYLTAFYIVENNLEKELVTQHLTDERWREIFMLVAGISKNPIHFLIEPMSNQAERYISSHTKLHKLLKWVSINKIGLSKLSERAAIIAIKFSVYIAMSPIKMTVSILDEIKETSAIISNASAIARATAENGIVDSTLTSATHVAAAISITQAIPNKDAIASIRTQLINGANSARDSANARGNSYQFFDSRSMSSLADNLMQLAKDTSQYTSSTDGYVLATRLRQAFLDIHSFDAEPTKFSTVEQNALRHYLYIAELIIRCEQAAIHISRPACQSLEAQLLTWKGDEFYSVV